MDTRVVIHATHAAAADLAALHELSPPQDLADAAALEAVGAP